MRKWDVSRDLDIDIYVPAEADTYFNKGDADEVGMTSDIVAKTLTKKLEENEYKNPSVEVSYLRTVDASGNEVDASNCKLEDCFAEFKVTITATQEGKYEEGIPSNNYYEPDDPPELEAYDEQETIDDIVGLVAAAFNEDDVTVDKTNIDDIEDNSEKWDTVIEALYDEPEPEYEPDLDF